MRVVTTGSPAAIASLIAVGEALAVAREQEQVGCPVGRLQRVALEEARERHLLLKAELADPRPAISPLAGPSPAITRRQFLLAPA